MVTDEQKAAMRKGSERPYCACRWVCQKNADKCFGYFTAKNVGTYPCPLAEKCLNDSHPNGQLERKFKVSKFGKLICDTDGQHRKEHHDKMRELQKTFFPEKEAESQHKCYVKRGKKQVRRPNLCDLIPGYVPMNVKPVPPPPCGGDCECGCPYDSCQYPDWDEEHSRTYVRARGSLENRETIRKNARKNYARKRERMANDPAFAESERAKNRWRNAKYKAKIKFLVVGGTPAQFEAMWAQAGGDLETFKTLCAKKGIKIIWDKRKKTVKGEEKP